MRKLLRGHRLVAIEKASGLDFVRRAEEVWTNKEILIIGDADSSGLVADATFSVQRNSGWWEGDFQLDASDVLAQISYSSGTTGPPKAIAISRRAVSDTISRLTAAMEMDSSIREYVAVPTTFSFGLGRVRAVAAVGGASYIPQEYRPDELARMLRTGDVNAFSVVPTMLRSLLQNPGLFRSSARDVRWIEIGSQYMDASEKLLVRSHFPNAIILQHYGLTEASRTTFLRVDLATASELETVGSPVGAARIKTDRDGRIMIAGPHVASGIVSDGEVRGITDSEGWLTTSDLGVFADGRLFFQGRDDDVANVGGIKVSAEHFEQQLRASLQTPHPFAACPIPDAIRGQRLGIFCEIGHADKIRAAVAQARDAAGLKVNDIAIIEVAEIPRTETGKIMRKQLSAIAQSTDAPASPIRNLADQDIAAPAISGTIIAALQDALGVEGVRPDDTFHDLGGDSLSAVGVMLRFEELSLPAHAVQRLFDGASVAQIAAEIDGSADRPEETRSQFAVGADALNAVRGLFAILILVSHWSPFFIERMGALGEAIWPAVAPALRIGTPGFAIVFGMGLGFFYFEGLADRQEHVRKRLARNTFLLLFGVTITAIAISARLLFTGEGFGDKWPERLFYTVLLYYVLIVPTALFWLRIVRRSRDHIFASLLLSLASYAVYLVCVSTWPQNDYTGWTSLAWHMLVAPYAYPRLLGATLLGLAIALWLRRSAPGANLPKDVARWGSLIAGAGFILLATVPGGWASNAGEVSAVVPFAGVTLLLYAGLIFLIEKGRAPLFVRALMVCGILAFPIFIAHGLVMPVSAIMQSAGVPILASLIIPAGLFVSSMVWLGLKVYKVRFGVGESVQN